MHTTSPPGPTQAGRPHKPITFNPADGSVTLHLSPGAWRWIARAVQGAVEGSKELDASDFTTFFASATQFLDAAAFEADEVEQAAAVSVCGLAALGRSDIAFNLLHGLPFGQQERDTVADLDQLSATPLFEINDGRGLDGLAAGDVLASVLVEVVA